ncbi:MAG: DNA primase [Deltaproteobacteria bacterium]|nr:DNA primase [Deltaproteobacteria bacterium]
MIPKSKIDEVKDRASIVEVVSAYVPLKKRGKSHLGLCPFHSEKTPSFTVSEEKKIFYCFGCRETGSVVDFVMKKEGVAFPDAVLSLARRYGVEIIEEKDGSADGKEPLYEALKCAAHFFRVELGSTGGAEARAYLKRRGYEGEILDVFHAGFAPNRWDGLVNHLRKNRIRSEAAEKAGLIVKKQNGGWYDRFRSRVIFPIHDLRGRVVAFGGRSLDNTEPKYLNSPESPVFRKGSVLYGLYQAKQSIMQESAAIVVEGYFDLLAMHGHGFTNCVATMGTALTSEHLRLLKPRAALCYALFDNDQAGRRAAIRCLDLFLDEELPCRAALIRGAKDPDELLARGGADAMREVISRAEPLMEFFLKDLRDVTSVTAPEGKARYLDNAVPMLLKVRNVAEKGHYAAFTAATLGIPVDAVYEALKMDAPAARTQGPRSPKTKALSIKEATLLRVLLRHPELYDARFDAAAEAFIDAGLKEAARVVGAFHRAGRGFDGAAILEALPEGADRSRVAEVISRDDDGFIESPGKMYEDCLKSIASAGGIKHGTRELLRALEERGNRDVAEEIMRRIRPGGDAKKRRE